MPQTPKSGSSAASPTLADVSKRAGVSTATVSRCLNSPAQVSQATREKVMQAVKELGYAPNFGAQALAAKRTNTFGAIVPTLENAIFANGLQAFQENLGKQGITLLVASSSYSREMEEEQIRNLVARGADALLLIGYDRTADSYEFLERRGIPYVIAWAFDAADARISVGFDNQRAMRQLADKVLDFGHKNLAMISAHRKGNDRARLRFQGVRDAMIARGLEPDQLAVVEAPYSFTRGSAAFADLMQRVPRPTAVICGNDVLATGAVKMAQEMGLRVPEDVSITGFDNIELAEIVTPGLTTVDVPHREMGLRAAEVLMQMRQEDSEGESQELSTGVKIRASLGPVPKV